MSADDVKLYVGTTTFPGQLITPEEASKTGILVLPGVEHGPFGDVFDRFAEAAADAGNAVARFELWQGSEDLTETTEDELHDGIVAGVEFLHARGYTTVVVVAKSFGARLVLADVPEGVDRMVLWAPAILFGEHEESRSITPSRLAEIDVPTRILQGDEDQVVSVENAAKLVEHLPRGELVELPGEDHSFRNDEARIVELTLEFLAD